MMENLDDIMKIIQQILDKGWIGEFKLAETEALITQREVATLARARAKV